jgi:hypothetical protein
MSSPRPAALGPASLLASQIDALNAMSLADDYTAMPSPMPGHYPPAQSPSAATLPYTDAQNQGEFMYSPENPYGGAGGAGQYPPFGYRALMSPMSTGNPYDPYTGPYSPVGHGNQGQMQQLQSIQSMQQQQQQQILQQQQQQYQQQHHHQHQHQPPQTPSAPHARMHPAHTFGSSPRPGVYRPPQIQQQNGAYGIADQRRLWATMDGTGGYPGGGSGPKKGFQVGQVGLVLRDHQRRSC